MRYRLIDWKTPITLGMILMSLATLSSGPIVPAAGHSVTKVTLDPPTPNVPVHLQNVTVSFSYATTEPVECVSSLAPLWEPRPRRVTPPAVPVYLQPGAVWVLRPLQSSRGLSR